MWASIVRTGVAKLVGWLVGLALAVGVVVPADASAELVAVVTAAVVALVELAYYVASRAVEQRWPMVGRVLLSAGLTRQVPEYRPAVDADTVPGYRR